MLFINKHFLSLLKTTVAACETREIFRTKLQEKECFAIPHCVRFKLEMDFYFRLLF